MARFFAGLVVLAALAVGVLVTWPQFLDLERTMPFAQLLVSRVALAALALATIVLLGLVALVARPLRGLAGGLCIVLVLVAGANVGIALMRGVGSFDGDDRTAAVTEGEVAVLSWNTAGDGVAPEIVADTAQKRGAAIIVLPETSASFGVAVVNALVANGSADFAVQSASLDPAASNPTLSTTVLVRADVGTYELRDGDTGGTGGTSPTLTLRSVDGNGPVIVAAHFASPMPLSMDEWRTDLSLVQTRCGDANTIIAGTLNGTIDHLGDLGRCTDAAVAVGKGAVGTWPAAAPAMVGAGFDRVITGADWRVRDFAALTSFDHAGSDHRPVFAVLAKR